MKFESLEAFHEAGMKMKNSGTKKSNKKMANAFFPKPAWKQSWQAAVEGKFVLTICLNREKFKYAPI